MGSEHTNTNGNITRCPHDADRSCPLPSRWAALQPPTPPSRPHNHGTSQSVVSLTKRAVCHRSCSWKGCRLTYQGMDVALELLGK